MMPQEARHGNHLLLKSILQVVPCFDLLIDSVVSLVVTRRYTTASKVLHPGWPIFRCLNVLSSSQSDFSDELKVVRNASFPQNMDRT
jgi:hypothetical protein